MRTFVVCTLATLIFSACQMLPKQTTGLEPSPEQKAKMKTSIEEAWSDFSRGDFEKSMIRFRAFQQQYPQSIFEVEARLGEARSLQGQQEWAAALQIDRQIVAERSSSHPELAALALYDQAASAEALGDETQMMAALLDANQRAQHLPEEISAAALPARLAIASMKLNQPEDAKKYLRLADQGVSRLRAKGFPTEKWAHLYFDMGSLSTNQLSPENFQVHLDSFAEGQIFLLKAIEAGVSPWSDRSLQVLQNHYRDFWNLAMNPPVTEGLDVGARERRQNEMKNRWLGEISKMTVILQQNRRPTDEQKSKQEQDLDQFIEKLENETEARLLETDAVIPLTPEARRRQKGKRGAKPPVQTLPPKKVVAPPHEDPNLQTGERK